MSSYCLGRTQQDTPCRCVVTYLHYCHHHIPPLNQYQSAYVGFAPTVHLKYTLLPAAILQHLRTLIQAADVVFFEAIPTDFNGPSSHTLSLNRKPMHEVYTTLELVELARLFRRHAQTSVSVPVLAQKQSSVLILPTKAFCPAGDLLDNYLLQYARTHRKKVQALDTGVIALTQTEQILTGLPEFTMDQARARLTAVDQVVQRYCNLFQCKPLPTILPDRFGLLYSRNLHWRGLIQNYRVQYPNEKVLVCAGSAHLFVPADYSVLI